MALNHMYGGVYGYFGRIFPLIKRHKNTCMVPIYFLAKSAKMAKKARFCVKMRCTIHTFRRKYPFFAGSKKGTIHEL